MQTNGEHGPNFSLKDEIREYWTRRAETFDQSQFHGMRAPGEKQAWQELVRAHTQAPEGARVLELAFGTGEITSVVLALGYRVTGLDLTEAMLAKAKAKYAQTKNLSLFLGDAEDTREADASYDAVVMRHLVWTLVDPKSAFRDWFRVLRPGGRLVVIDGDFSESSLSKRLRRKLSQWVAKLEGAREPAIDWEAHWRIMRQVHFSMGLTPGRLRPMLEDAGFTDFRLESLEKVRAVQRRSASLSGRLQLGLSESFVLSCARPFGSS